MRLILLMVVAGALAVSQAMTEPLEVQKLKKLIWPHSTKTTTVIVEPTPVPPSVIYKEEIPKIEPSVAEKQQTKPKPKPRSQEPRRRQQSTQEQPGWFCSQACAYVAGKTKEELAASRGIATAQQIRDGRACVYKYCPNAIKR